MDGGVEEAVWTEGEMRQGGQRGRGGWEERGVDEAVWTEVGDEAGRTEGERRQGGERGR